MIRVVLPAHLRALARAGEEVELEGDDITTLGSVLDVLEARYPVLQGTIRDRITLKRRPFIRFFACERDFSHHDAGAALPDDVVHGRAPFLVVGAMAGG